ncbi:hypothetical protein BpHYR1_018918 [Brachionus plicatilis]|uniref:Transmembrane protein n=1 Tax=Brachionus plicatilis TaxID=10195 RepID=A0A3M7S791_BRAPC|nr:hypothetical protein BpHYR1_018918 [Brachionus plicatilis]
MNFEKIGTDRKQMKLSKLKVKSTKNTFLLNLFYFNTKFVVILKYFIKFFLINLKEKIMKFGYLTNPDLKPSRFSFIILTAFEQNVTLLIFIIEISKIVSLASCLCAINYILIKNTLLDSLKLEISKKCIQINERSCQHMQINEKLSGMRKHDSKRDLTLLKKSFPVEC